MDADEEENSTTARSPDHRRHLRIPHRRTPGRGHHGPTPGRHVMRPNRSDPHRRYTASKSERTSLVARTPRVVENTADVVHTRLRDAILSGDLRPNHRLVEVDLAVELGVSRTPVREALLRLRQEGLVAQHKGWLVRDHDPAEVLEYLEARAALESVTAGLAAARIDETALSELRALLEQMNHDARPRREINELNTRFHRIITEAGGNAVLTSFAHNTEINYWSFSTPIVFSDTDDLQVDAEHRELLHALENRDAAAAADVAKRHVEATMAIISRSLGLPPR
ncbi:MAG: GntR family transcriptional regulator [Microbacterium sp.]